MIKWSSAAESLLFRESSSRLHGSIDFEVWRDRKWARNRSLGIKNDVGSGRKRSAGVFGAVQGDQRGPWGLQDGILRPSEAPGRHFGGPRALEYAGDAGDGGMRRATRSLRLRILTEVLPGFHTPCTPDKQGAADSSAPRIPPSLLASEEAQCH